MKKPLFIIAILFIVLMVFLLLRYGPVLLAERGDYGLDIRRFTQAIDSGELSQENLSIAYYNRGNAWSNKGKYNRAIADYTKAIEIDPEYADAYYNRALAWKNKGYRYYKKAAADFKKSTMANRMAIIANLTKIIEMTPNDPKVYYNRGIIWKKIGDYDKALADYTKAIEIDPNYTNAYNSRGHVWYAKGDYEKAIADYTQAIDINPKDPILYFNRGNAWRNKADYNRAIADYTKTIEVDPNYAEAYNKLAWLKATCPDNTYRDGVRAVELAKKAVELKEAYYTLGTLAAAYAEAGRFQDATKTQKRAIEKLKKEGYGKKIAEYEERLASYKAGKPWREK